MLPCPHPDRELEEVLRCGALPEHAPPPPPDMRKAAAEKTEPGQVKRRAVDEVNGHAGVRSCRVMRADRSTLYHMASHHQFDLNYAHHHHPCGACHNIMITSHFLLFVDLRLWWGWLVFCRRTPARSAMKTWSILTLTCWFGAGSGAAATCTANAWGETLFQAWVGVLDAAVLGALIVVAQPGQQGPCVLLCAPQCALVHGRQAVLHIYVYIMLLCCADSVIHPAHLILSCSAL